MEGAVEVQWGVRASSRGEARRHVEHWGCGCKATLESGRVEEGLERRAGLARCKCHVDLAAVGRITVGRAADHRDDAASSWLDRDERGVRHVAVGELGETNPH